MTLELRVAARPEPLLDELADWLSAPVDDPFQVDVVVVPNAGMREWAATELLDRFGVLSHVEFVFPAELTRRVLALPAPALDPWRPERLAWHVLALMASEAELGATPWEGLPARPWGVARRVADLLERYATQRPDLIGAWIAGVDTDGSEELAPSRRWQAVTWRALRERVGEASSAERLLAVLDGQDAAAKSASVAAATVLPSRVALLGVSSLSAPFAAVLTHAAQERDVLVLATAASPRAVLALPDSTADAPHGRAMYVAALRASELDVATHPLLLSWGRPALEAATVLARLPAVPQLLPREDAGPDVDERAAHQLGALQAAVRDGAPAAQSRLDRTREGDGSVQVHACHGLVRQLEVVRDAILHAMSADPTLLPRDIAVLCTDLESVAPLAVPILGADVAGRSLPVLVTDRAAASAPPVQAALDAALALATSRLERDEVLTFLSLPVVCAALGLDAEDLAALESSADALDVRWGRDAAHRTGWGYPPHITIGTWRETLDRLIAGLLLDADGGPVGGIAPASGIGTPDIARVGRIADALTVVGHLATIAERARPMSDWAAPLRWLVDTLLRPHRAVDGERHDFAGQAAQVRAVIDELVADALAAEVELAIDLREVRAALADRLTSGGSRARLRTGHISVASLTPLRGVPFRVIALVGVDDSMASSAGADDDDVLALAPRVGERDAADERRAALLDALLAARDTVIVTCDGQDVRTGRVLDLPTVVEELLDALPAAAPELAGVPLVVRHPRHLADRRNLTVGEGSLPRRDVTQPWAFAPATLRAVEALEAVGDAPAPGVGVLTEPTAGDHWRTILLPPRSARSEAPSLAVPDLVQLHLDEVIAALVNPTRVLLRERLGIRLPGELASPPRPVALWVEDGLERWRLGDDLLTHLAAGGSAEGWIASRPASGGVPPGAIGRELLASFVEEVRELHDLSGATSSAQSSALSVEMALESAVLGARRVRIVGSVEHHAGWIVDAAYSKDHPSHRLRAAVRLLALTADRAHHGILGARVVRRAPSSKDATGVHELQVAAGDAAARAELATAALASLVDLALRIRIAPAPLLPRAAWRIGADTDVHRPPMGELASDVSRDLEDATTRVVLGATSLPELALQDDGALEEGLPEAPTPVQRWSLALRSPLAAALEGVDA